MIITIANNKGGVSKTTIATHLATWLVLGGRRIVLVDLDTQGSVAHFFGLPPANDLAALVRAVLYFKPKQRPEIKSFLTPVPGYKDLVVIRGWGQSAQLEFELNRSGSPPAMEVLQQALNTILNIPKIHVVIDTGPFAGVLQEAALAIADHVIVPGIPEGFTEAGVLNIARRLQQINRGITGIIPTKVITNASEHRRTILDWQNAFGSVVYYDPEENLYGLPRRVVWGALPRYNRPIWEVAPLHKAAREMETVLGRIAHDTGI